MADEARTVPAAQFREQCLRLVDEVATHPAAGVVWRWYPAAGYLAGSGVQVGVSIHS